MSNLVSLFPRNTTADRLRALLTAARLEAERSRTPALAKFLDGYVEGVAAGVETWGTQVFPVLDTLMKGNEDQYSEGYRIGLLNVEIASR